MTPQQRWSFIRALALAVGFVVFVAVVGSVFGARKPDAQTIEATASASVEPPTPSPSPTPTILTAAEISAEIAAFRMAQQADADGTLPEAHTSAQQEFVDGQQSTAELFGPMSNYADAPTSLALAMTACEYAIRSSHLEPTSAQFESFLATDPLVTSLVGTATGAERDAILLKAVRSMNGGVSYLCPDDFSTWNDDFDSMYP